MITRREVTCHAVREIHHKFKKVTTMLRKQRGITIEEIQQALSEEEGMMRINDKEPPSGGILQR